MMANNACFKLGPEAYHLYARAYSCDNGGMIRAVDPFNDLDVRKRCHLLLTSAKRYGAIRHFRHPHGAHIMWEGKRAPLTVELAVSALKERGLLMRDGASALVLTRAGADLLQLWNEQVFGVAEPVTNETAQAQQTDKRS